MNRILAFGASNSSQSLNQQFAEYTVGLLEPVEPNIIYIDDYEMPLFGVDREKAEGIPTLAHDFLKQIKASDGIIISFAEHNGAYTTAFKNIFDWVSRIKGDMWSGIPMLALSTSPGARGGKSVLGIAMNRFQFMGGNVVAHFSLPSFNDNFKKGEGIVNDDLARDFKEQLQIFADELSLSIKSQ